MNGGFKYNVNDFIPNNGAGDNNILDDIYVAAMGGGYGTQFEGVGSNLTLINLEDDTNPMSLYKRIEIWCRPK